MRSDVPLGTFLSGGLDSIIVALASQISSSNIQTFTASFPRHSNDEAKYAKMISHHFGTDHKVLEIDDNIINFVPDIIANLDQPFADSSIFPQFLICKEASQHVTVTLSGDGGDELFAGYKHYDYFALEEKFRKLFPQKFNRIFGYLGKLLPDRHKTNTIKRLLLNNIYDSMAEHSSDF